MLCPPADTLQCRTATLRCATMPYCQYVTGRCHTTRVPALLYDPAATLPTTTLPYRRYSTVRCCTMRSCRYATFHYITWLRLALRYITLPCCRCCALLTNSIQCSAVLYIAAATVLYSPCQCSTLRCSTAVTRPPATPVASTGSRRTACHLQTAQSRHGSQSGTCRGCPTLIPDWPVDARIDQRRNH